MPELYFDNSSTTRVDRPVADLVYDVMLNRFGNPSSLHHKGVEAQLLLDKARRQVLLALGARSGKVIFTSGGTEANNLAVLGAARALKKRGNRIITTAFEHSSVLEPFQTLSKEGFDCVFIPPEADGSVSREKILAACDENTVLVSLMAVNNELGSILPLENLGPELRQRSPNALFHTDAVQAFGKVLLRAGALGADLITVSGHKIHAPKGIGALYLADKARVLPLFYGGGQQEKIRPGTESMPLICGFGLAAQTAAEHREENARKAAAVRARLIERLSALPEVVLHLPRDASPYILNCSVMGFRSETMLHYLEERGIYVSSGSACSKGARSHVLKSIGLSDREADSALRLSLSKYNDTAEADLFADALSEGVKTLRRSF